MKVSLSKQKRLVDVPFVDFLLLGIVLFLLDDDTFDWLDDVPLLESQPPRTVTRLKIATTKRWFTTICTIPVGWKDNLVDITSINILRYYYCYYCYTVCIFLFLHGWNAWYVIHLLYYYT
jgi:hypothetical protein